MIRRLAQIRLSWLQIGLVALTSAIATAVVIVDVRPESPSLEATMLAALQRQRLVIHHLGSRSGSGGAGATSAAAALSPNLTPVSAGASTSSGTAPVSSGTASSPSSTATGLTSSPGGSGTSTAKSATQPKASKVKHVFVIALSTPSYDAAFGHGSVARYLDGKLVPSGTLLTHYRSLGDSELSDYLAMVSGQAPNADTSAGCSTYAEFPATAKPDRAGDVPGSGCVYPDAVLTIGDQMTGSGKVWKAYLEGLGTATCVHADSGAPDNAVLPGAGSNYDTRHNPFIYFHSLLDLGDCAADDQAITQLPADLHSTRKTPAYAFIAPGLCEDSDQTTCANGAPGGLAGEDAFLRRWVPKILHSKAYRQGGALMIVFTISKPPRPAATGTTGTTGTTGSTGVIGPSRTVGAPGSGARTVAGALVISPYGTAGKKVSGSFDPYSVLRSIDDLFGLPALARAAHARSFVTAVLPSA